MVGILAKGMVTIGTTLPTAEQTIDLSHFPNGVYLLHAGKQTVKLVKW